MFLLFRATSRVPQEALPPYPIEHSSDFPPTFPYAGLFAMSLEVVSKNDMNRPSPRCFSGLINCPEIEISLSRYEMTYPKSQP